MTPEETYALKIVADYAESGVEDDIDEDGELPGDTAHDVAIDLAYMVIRFLRAEAELILGMARRVDAAPEGEAGG
jgi:hypothetical protein